MDLKPLFHPRSIAIIGASPTATTGRWSFLDCLIDYGYRGSIYPVNPKYREIRGYRSFASVKDVPDSIDMAIIAVKAPQTSEVLEDCVQKGVRFAVVFTSGFAEAGNVGLERRLVEIARKGVTRIVGPNCIGVHCPASRIFYYSDPCSSLRGKVGFVSQSGGHAINFTMMGASLGLSFSKVLSIGNQSDLAHQDVISYYGEDPEIRVITAYVEDIKNGRDFIEKVREVAARKPLILWKGGITEDGARAAKSHTAAMASGWGLFASVMKQLGVILVDEMEEMADTAIASLRLPELRGLRTGLVIVGGGSSVEMTDGCAREGLSVPVLRERTRQRIRALIPEENTSVLNPVDLGAFGMVADIYGESIVAVAEDDGIDLVVICQTMEFFVRRGLQEAEKVSDAIVEASARISKPVVCIAPRISEMNPRVEQMRTEHIMRLRKGGIISFPTVRRAARAIVRLFNYHRFRQRSGWRQGLEERPREIVQDQLGGYGGGR